MAHSSSVCVFSMSVCISVRITFSISAINSVSVCPGVRPQTFTDVVCLIVCRVKLDFVNTFAL